MSTMTLPEKNGSSVFKPADSWMVSSVQAFFQKVNWEDNPPEIQEIKLTSAQEVSNGTSGDLSLTLKVSQFFAAVNWDGVAIAAPISPEEPPAAEPTEDALTIDTFFDLF